MHRSINSRRRGISLMEVLFSIGLDVLGVMGIAILLPVATYRAQKGLRADRSSALGRNALHEFDSRGLKLEAGWLQWNPSNNRFFTPSNVGDPNHPNNNSSPPNPGLLIGRQAVCIDPYFIARNAEANGGTMPNPVEWFPYTNLQGGNDIDPAFRRTPLLSTQFSQPNNPHAMPRLTLDNGQGLRNAMSSLQAESIFLENDNLIFDLPEKDKTLPPIQNYGGTVSRRQTKGNLSWYVTIAPRLDAMTVDTSNPGLVISDANQKQYTLSIVVVEDRVPLIASPTTGVNNAAGERVALVSNFLGGGYGGGEVAMITRNANRPITDLNLKRDRWVMLSGFFRDGSNQPVLPVVHSWYKVAAADDKAERVTISGVDVFRRYVTLQGPDFPVRTSAATPGVWPEDVRVTMVKGVVAVFEKSFRIENTSLWRQ